MKVKLLLACFVFLLFAGFALSATYYVSTAGSDSNPGSQASPFRTIQKCANAAQAGDTCLVLPGIYKESVTLPRSGTAGSPITFKSSVPQQAILDGSQALTGWTQCLSQAECGNNANWQHIYYTNLPAGVTPFTANLIEDDSFLWIAEEPDQPDHFFFGDYANFFSSNSSNMTTTSIVDPNVFNQSDPNFWNGASVLLWTLPNVVSRRSIKQFVPSENKIYYDSIADPSGYDKYAIYNSIWALNEAGEYYIDPSGKAFVWPRAGTGSITVSVRRFGIDTANNDYLVIDGFKIQKFSGDTTTDGIAIGTLNPAGNSVNIIVKNNEIAHNMHDDRGYGGIYFSSCVNCTISDNNFFENFDQIGIFITNTSSSGTISNVILNNNSFIRQGNTSIWLFGRYTGAKNFVISNNYIANSAGPHSNAITVYGYPGSLNENTLVINNKVLNSNFSLAYHYDMNIVITGNTFVDTTGDGRVIANGEGMNGIYISNNTLIGVIDAPIGTNPFIVKDNILGGFCPNTGGMATASNNLYHAVMWCQKDGYGNPVLAPTESYYPNVNGIFVDPGNFNFSLKGNVVGSPPVNPCTMSSTGGYVGAIPCLQACSTASDCSDNACNSKACVSGQCVYSPVSNGTSCSDGAFCNGAEICQSGSCVSGSSPCPEDNYSCTSISCNESGDSCSTSNNDSSCLSGFPNCSGAVCNPSLYPVNGCGGFLPSGCEIVQAPQGLVLWIKADDSVGTGDPAIDSSGNNLNATCSGSDCPVYSASGGKFGGAYTFNGSVGKLTLPVSTLLRLSSQTKAAWINLASYKIGGYNVLFGDETGDYIALNSSSNWKFAYANGSGTSVYADLAGSQIPLNSWHHVAFVYVVSGNNVNIKYYLDGVLQSQINGTSGFTPKALLRIANYSPYTGAPLNGSIDDIRVYDSALSQQEIQAMMAGNSPPSCLDLTSDNKIDLFDLVFVALRIGNLAGDPADVVGNDGVNIQDLQEVAMHFGQNCQG